MFLLLAAFVMFFPAVAEGADDALAEPRSASQQWEFNRSDDVNYDQFPDDWHRVIGPGYPAYQEVLTAAHDEELLAQAEAVDRSVALWLRSLRSRRSLRTRLPAIAPFTAEELVDRYLRVELNGGGTRVRSLPFPVAWSFSYRVSVKMACEGLENGSARTELVFVDAQDRVLSRHASQSISHDAEWDTFEIGPVSPKGNAVRGYLQLTVDPERRGDIGGWVGFDSVRINELPQLKLQANAPAALYPSNAPVVLRCDLSGVHVENAVLGLTVTDAVGTQVARHDLPIKLARRDANGDVRQSVKGLSGTAEWIVPVDEPGFYRIEAALKEPARTGLKAKTSLAVIEPLPSDSSAFGWTVSHLFPGLSLRQFPQLLSDCHVGWAKIPCWIDVQDRKSADDIAWTMERLQGRGIRCIGMLDQPHSSVRELFPGKGALPAAVIFRDAAQWQPTLDPLMPRFNLRTVWWQLGSDRDYSFTRQPDLPTTIDDIRHRLQGFSQAISMVISWPIDEPATTESGGWRAECLGSNETLTAAELDAQLEQRGEVARKTWILLDPLGADEHTLEQRIRDLVMRMIVVRRHDVEAAFVSRPLDPDRGLFDANGLPADILLPWRTTAALIGDMRHEGQLQLPNHSSNALLGNEDEAMMVVWSERPKTEVLYLGENVRQYDVWGRSHPLEIDRSGRHPRHIVPVDRTPTFLVGVDPNIARWRRSVALRPARLDSFLGKRQNVDLHFGSPLKQGASGSAQLQLPETWQTDQLSFPFDADSGAEVDVPIDIRLQNDATTGPVRLEINFDFIADKPYRFTVWRNVAVGPEDIEMKLFSRIDEAGRLVIRQDVLNKGTQSHRYDCLMFAPPRRRQRARLTIPAGEEYSHEYIWPNGRELVGTTITLRAEQIGGNRILNYQISAAE